MAVLLCACKLQRLLCTASLSCHHSNIKHSRVNDVISSAQPSPAQPSLQCLDCVTHRLLPASLAGFAAGYDWKSFRLLFTYFWHRLVGTGGIWFCNDWYFYGNGVFRSTFVGLLVGSNASVQVNWLYSYINAGVQVSLCASSRRGSDA